MDSLTQEQVKEVTVNRSKASDGGSVGEEPDSPFHTVSDVEITKSERYRMLINQVIVAPGKVIWNDYRTRIGITIVLLYVLAGTIGVAIVPVPHAGDGPTLLPPFTNWEFPLGTNQVGKGILAMVIHATPAMLKMITAGAVFSTGVATIWGPFSGYKGGAIDRVMTTIADVFMAIPALPLVIVIVAIVQPKDPVVVGLLLSINVWAGFARMLRSQVLSIREASYVEASRTMGIGTSNIVVNDILPNLMPLVTMNFVISARRVIISSVGLYFLGVLPFTSLNWGVMMNIAYKSGALYSLKLAHWFLAPMITVVILSLGLILLGQGMDRIFNPRIRARHMKRATTEDDSKTATTEDDDSTDTTVSEFQ
jgi:peptide/nickel transport system permease protein